MASEHNKYAAPTELVIRPGNPRVMLANPATAASAFPSIAYSKLTTPYASVDLASSAGNYAVLPAGKGVTTFWFNGAGSNNETMKVRILGISQTVSVAPGATTATREYFVGWHVADLTCTLSSSAVPVAGGNIGGATRLFADTIVADFITDQSNVVSPASDTPAYVEISNVGNMAWLVLFHRNTSSADNCNGLYMTS